MLNEIDDFDKVIAEKQHAEFMRAMKNLMTTLEKLNNSPSIERALQSLSDKISNLKLSVNSPDVNVETNQKEVVSAIQKMTNDLRTELQKMSEEDAKEEKKEEWTFTVHRDSNGFIQKVTATK